MSGFRAPGRNRERINATADLTLTANDVGKTITNVGAGQAVNLTLPPPATCRPGDDFVALSCADQQFTVSGQAAGDLIAFNNTAANSVSLQTAGERAGGGFLITCVDGHWQLGYLTAPGQTVTTA